MFDLHCNFSIFIFNQITIGVLGRITIPVFQSAEVGSKLEGENVLNQIPLKQYQLTLKDIYLYTAKETIANVESVITLRVEKITVRKKSFSI